MSDDNVYTAERIVAKRTHNGITQYYIKWKNYSSKDNTWEPYENIIDRKLLEDFEKRQPKRAKRLSSARDESTVSSNGKQPRNSDESLRNKEATPKLGTQRSEVLSTPESPKPLVIEPDQIEEETQRSSLTNQVAEAAREQQQEEQEEQQQEEQEEQQQRRRWLHSPGTTEVTSRTPERETKVVSVVESASSPGGATRTTGTLASEPQGRNSTFTLPRGLPVEANYNEQQQQRRQEIQKHYQQQLQASILNTFITDVTVNDQTITICESKTNQGFFREVSRHSVAVDTTHAGECVDRLD